MSDVQLHKQGRALSAKRLSLSSTMPLVRVLAAVGATVGVVEVAMFDGTPSAVCFLILLCLIGSGISLWIGGGDQSTLKLFITVYFVNILFVIFVYHYYDYLYGAPYYRGGSDDLWYEQNARIIANHLSLFDYEAMSGVVQSNYYGYFYVVSVIQRIGDALGGAHTLNPRLLNSFSLALLSVLIFRLGKASSFSTRVSLRAAYVSGLFPLMSYYSAFIVRDTLVALLLVACTYLFVSLSSKRDRGAVIYLVLLALLLRILWEFRSYNVILFLFVLAIWFGWSRWRQSRLVGKLVTLGLVIGLLLFLWSLYGNDVLRVVNRLDFYEEYQLERAAPDGLSRFVFNAPVPLTYLLRIAYALISPLPVPTNDLARLYVNFGTMIWFFLMPFIFSRLSSALKNPSIIPLMFLGIFLAISMIGYNDRHILSAYPFAFLLAFDGMERHSKQTGRVGLLMAWISGLLVPLYIFLKVN